MEEEDAIDQKKLPKHYISVNYLELNSKGKFLGVFEVSFRVFSEKTKSLKTVTFRTRNPQELTGWIKVLSLLRENSELVISED